MSHERSAQDIIEELDSIDCFFDRPDINHQEIKIKDLPYTSRPIVEMIHHIQPDVIVAADRGARLFGLSVKMGWNRRYPTEDFPTLDRKIHFARISSRSTDNETVRNLVHNTLDRSGLIDSKITKPNIVFLDDWIRSGLTVERFVDAVEEYGIDSSAITIGTICGLAVSGLAHVIGDPTRDPQIAEWDLVKGMTGVEYFWSDTHTAELLCDPEAIIARDELIIGMNEYYRDFLDNKKTN